MVEMQAVSPNCGVQRTNSRRPVPGRQPVTGGSNRENMATNAMRLALLCYPKKNDLEGESGRCHLESQRGSTAPDCFREMLAGSDNSS